MTTTDTGEKHRLACSFCGKQKADVDKLIAGPGVFICGGCVRAAEQILIDDAVESLDDMDSKSDDELLATMVRIHRSREDVDHAVSQHVRALRARNIAWARIGEVLGISRQSAWERYSEDA